MQKIRGIISAIIRGESGTAPLATLPVLVLSGLLIAPYLSYISTNTNAARMT